MNKIWIIMLGALGIFGGVVAGAAFSSWNQSITWAPSIEEITVNQPTTLDYGILVLPLTKVEVYNVTNTGNVAVTVTASASATGATPTWNMTSATINPNTSKYFQLTLIINAAGSATVTFS